MEITITARSSGILNINMVAVSMGPSSVGPRRWEDSIVSEERILSSEITAMACICSLAH